MKNLVLTIRAQEMVAIGQDIKLKIFRDGNRRLKLVIAAPESVRIVRIPLPPLKEVKDDE